MVLRENAPGAGHLRAVVTGTHDENGVTVRDVRLEFGPGRRATLRVQLMIPPGKGPFPRFSDRNAHAHTAVGAPVRAGHGFTRLSAGSGQPDWSLARGSLAIIPGRLTVFEHRHDSRRRRLCHAILVLPLAALLGSADPYAADRERMVREQIESRGIRGAELFVCCALLRVISLYPLPAGRWPMTTIQFRSAMGPRFLSRISWR